MPKDTEFAQPKSPPRTWLRQHVQELLQTKVGGTARLRIIVLLAAVLALSTADLGVITAISVQLKSSLGIGNTGIGLLVSASTGVGAIATLPMGVIADRTNRAKLLSISILVWCAAIVACGAATSYSMLLITRIALGLLVAAAGPLVASLVGDFFPATERGRIYGYILSGEIIGIGIGIVACGNIAAMLTWRYAFWVLVPPGLILAWAIWRLLPEPRRGGAGVLEPEQPEEPVPADRLAEPSPTKHQNDAPEPAVADPDPDVTASDQRTVARDNAVTLNFWRAMRYILSIRTNLALILASALGYFYFAGLQTFAIIYFHNRYGLSTSASTNLLVLAGLGALVGLSLTGRIADTLSKRRYVGARPFVAGIAFLLCAVLLSTALLLDSLVLTVPFLFLAAGALGGANPPLDAARLDIMPPQLRGRAESARTVLRSALVALAPTLFGVLSARFTSAHNADSAGGLRDTLLIMLATLVMSGLILVFFARRTYAKDVETARAVERRTSGQTIDPTWSQHDRPID